MEIPGWAIVLGMLLLYAVAGVVRGWLWDQGAEIVGQAINPDAPVTKHATIKERAGGTGIGLLWWVGWIALMIFLLPFYEPVLERFGSGGQLFVYLIWIIGGAVTLQALSRAIARWRAQPTGRDRRPQPTSNRWHRERRAVAVKATRTRAAPSDARRRG